MALSFDQIRELLSAAIREKYPLRELWVRDVYPDYCIIHDWSGYEDARFFKVSYSINESSETVTLTDDAVEVRMVIDYLPMVEDVALSEAISDSDGWKWRVVLIAPGLSKNGYFYSEDVLRTATPLFEGVRALSRTDAAHLENRDKSVENIVGWYSDCQYVEGVGVVATLNITEDADWLRMKIRSAADAGKMDLVQFSIVASGSGRRQITDGIVCMYVDSIDHVEFVDSVVDAAAGGRVLQLVASVSEKQKKELAMLQNLLAMLKAQRPDLYARVDETNVTEEQVTQLLTEAMVVPTTPQVTESITPPVVVPPIITPIITQPQVPLVAAVPPVVTTPPAAPVIDTSRIDQATSQALQMLEAATTRYNQITEAAERREQVRESRGMVRDTLAICQLPAATVTRLQQQFNAMLDAGTVITAVQVAEAIKQEREYLATLHTSGAIVGYGPEVAGQINMGESAQDKASKMLDAFFEKKDGVSSIRECYIAITGDKRVSGLLREATNLSSFHGHLRESLNTTVFDQIFADAMNRQLVREYSRLNLGLWRNICDVVPASDFRTRHRIRVGGYANLATVAQGNPYPSLVSPTDEEATYAVVKHGGTEDLTMEMFRNDDVNSVRLIPLRMARAAAQTLHEFVFNFVNTNGVIYDTVALFHATHNNLTAVAFDAPGTQYMAHRRMMRAQVEMNSLKPLGLLPKVLMVPNTLEEVAYNAFRQDTNNAPRLVQTNEIRPMIIVVDYWTDANNWYTASSIDQTPLIELAFLDGNEDPEMMVQDMPEVGSMFTNDKRTYKIRHIYGGCVVDYRGFTGAIVA